MNDLIVILILLLLGGLALFSCLRKKKHGCGSCGDCGGGCGNACGRGCGGCNGNCHCRQEEPDED